MNPAVVRSALASLSDTALASQGLAERIVEIAERYRTTLARGGTLWFAGNGGSAADAQHLAAEYVVRRAGPGRAAVALTTDTSVLTATGNDVGFDEVFARQVEALVGPDDLLILHSTTGESPNLLSAAHAARRKGVPVMAFLGRGGGALAQLADLTCIVPSNDTARIQEMHLALEHIIASLLEAEP